MKWPKIINYTFNSTANESSAQKLSKITGSYSINLLWINSKKAPYQQYIYPTKTLKELNTKLHMPAVKWAKANPAADVSIWYDSSLYDSQTIANTKEALAKLASQQGCRNVKLQDIRDISIVKDNPDLFADGMPLYLRIDLLKMILCLHSLTQESKDAAIFSDLEVGDLRQDGQRMNKAELFDKESVSKLQKVGVLVNKGSITYENQYIQVINNEHIILALKYAINACIIRVSTMWNEKETFLNFDMEQLHTIPLHSTLEELYLCYTGIKNRTMKVRADFVGEGQKSEWISYNPDKHGYSPLGNVWSASLRYFYYMDSSMDSSEEWINRDEILKFKDDLYFDREHVWQDYNLRIKKVDVRRGKYHIDQYDTEKRKVPIKYKLWEELKAGGKLGDSEQTGHEEVAAIELLFNNIKEHCKAIQIFQENKPVPIIGDGDDT